MNKRSPRTFGIILAVGLAIAVMSGVGFTRAEGGNTLPDPYVVCQAAGGTFTGDAGIFHDIMRGMPAQEATTNFYTQNSYILCHFDYQLGDTNPYQTIAGAATGEVIGGTIAEHYPNRWAKIGIQAGGTLVGGIVSSIRPPHDDNISLERACRIVYGDTSFSLGDGQCG